MRITKLQTPNSKEAPNFKFQPDVSSSRFEVWGLVLIWCLVFGVWCFFSHFA